MANVLIATIPVVYDERAHQRVLARLKYWPQSSTTDLASALGYLMVEYLLNSQCVSASVFHSLHQNEYGKWMLSNSPIDFNISHSGNKVVAVITDNGKAGIDIEQLRPISWQDYKDVFSPEEWLLLNSAHHPESLFFDLWTKKESLTKAYGLGMQLEFSTVRINENKGCVLPTSMEGYFYPIMVPQYTAHVCLTHRQGVFVKKFDFQALSGTI